MTKVVIRIVFYVAVMALLVSCAAQRSFRAGEKLEQQGRYDEAVQSFREAVTRKPEKHEYRIRLMSAQQEAAAQHHKNGVKLQEQGNHQDALVEFQTALAYDPTYEIAGQSAMESQKILERRDLLQQAEEAYRLRRFGQARQLVAKVQADDPGNRQAEELLDKIRNRGSQIGGFELALNSGEPITLTFKETKVKDAFTILSRLSGINFIFDEGVKKTEITLNLEKTSFQQALELMLVMAELDKKVLNPKTILLHPNTREKKKQYEEQLIQTFYLSNIDAKKAVNLLRTMLQLRKVYVHEELNAIVVRDEPETIELARQMLEAADRGDSEVIFDLELIEVSKDDYFEFGPNFGEDGLNIQAGFAKVGTATSTIVPSSLASGDATVNLLNGAPKLSTFYTIPTLNYKIKKIKSDTETLANPKIRVKNREKAKVHVGDREPILTVTNNNGTTSESFQYVDVGIKLDIEPSVQLDNTVLTKISLEVSSKGKEVGNTSKAFQITTTNAQTVLTLRDGEQTIIGGLIKDYNQDSKSMLPFLSELPIIGALFTGFDKTKQKKEILLSITPHIVRRLDLPDAQAMSIWSGGEEDLKAGPNLGYYFPEEIEEGGPVDLQLPVDSVSTSGEEKQVAEKVSVPAEETGSGLGIKPESRFAPTQEKATGLSGDLVPPAAGDPVGFETGGPPPSDDSAPVQGQAPGGTVQEIPSEELVVLPPDTEAVVSSGGILFLEGPKLVSPGEEFVVRLMIDEVAGLYSAPLFVTYDAKVLEFVSADEGSFLKNGPVDTLFTSSVDPRTGRLIIGAKQGIGGEGVSGGGELLSIRMRGKAVGKSAINPERLNFRDPAGKLLNLRTQPMEVEVR